MPDARAAATPTEPGRALPDAVPTVSLRLFAAAREAAGSAEVLVTASTVDAVLAEARGRFGEAFAAVAAISRVWVNGQPADAGTVLGEGDEVAVLPPVSGGCAS